MRTLQDVHSLCTEMLSILKVEDNLSGFEKMDETGNVNVS